ncbi:MAG: DUF4347 domain-containing protein [Magnetococcales bacterium]|nr:DUF4347 domain-containing protein [Magnetococcales bacterium]
MATAVAVIDTALTDYQSLVASLPPELEIILLDPHQDGLSQLASALTGRSGIDAIHLFSHGAPGSLQLGSTTLTTANLARYATALSTIGSSLTPDGDLLLYGCNVAAGDTGLAFINALAQSTSADVAASDDLTGQGGDWLLEQHRGTVTAATFTPRYSGALATASFADKVNYAVDVGPIYAAIADVNHDSWPDILVVNYNSNVVSVMRNNGNGTFAAKVDYAIGGPNPHHIVAADINDDGWSDILTTNQGGSTIQILYNNGDGTFASNVSYTVERCSSFRPTFNPGRVPRADPESPRRGSLNHSLGHRPKKEENRLKQGLPFLS